MRQQVNLLPPDAHRRRKQPFSFYFLLTGGVLIAALMLVSVTAAYQTSKTAEVVDLLTKTRAQNEANLEQMRARVATHVTSADLQTRLAETRRQLTIHRNLYDALTHGQLGNSRGFSQVLVGLAKSKPESLWLRQIMLNAGGQRLDLEGSALDPTAIPIYLQHLGKETSLTGRGVNQIEITRAEARTTHLDFTIRSELKP